MKLLAIECCTEALSLALADDESVLERHSIAGRANAELLLPRIEELLAEAGWAQSALSMIACGCGPGSFTGVRICVAAAQAMAFALDVPVYTASTLRILAQGAEHQNVLAALDARMQQVYAATFTRDAEGLMQVRSEPVVCDPSDVVVTEGDLHGVGHGFGAFADTLEALVQTYDAEAMPRARDLITLASAETESAVEAGLVMPQYVRNDVAKVLGQAR